MSSELVLVTGGSGFVGKSLIKTLCMDQRYSLIASTRYPHGSFPSAVHSLFIQGLDGDTDWQSALTDVGIVVHLAARVHVMHESDSDPLMAFRKVNVDGTLNLARQAARAGVKRFVYISSIKVNGEGTSRGKPYTADDVPAPIDPYGISKYEAEQGLLALAAGTGMEVVIIRPVLVYGPGVKANMLSMMRWLSRGVPLPLGAIDNRRSLVAIDNLVDLIVTCLEHPGAANQIFLASDGEDVSTTGLLRRMGASLGCPVRLLPVPAGLLRCMAILSGKGAMSQRLLGSLQVDIEKNHRLLGWSPPVTLDQALLSTARHFLESDQA
ncbi:MULTISPECIES: UDP-glucose 4-epimerase family protein [Pseudomonas]|jgi:nucleoside-diphosphate-sugar epimerase|uniref:UDP-glucose 4-epimerase family protein n=1 Tax=Pseudomonas TaxID=286 RepID=UPI001D79CB02|nr:SDR family oxidoreductase [Pseudomonas sp. Bi123]CAH0263239.1 N-acetyl-alpha-D-glucosaminyl-diphospho-ditrans, octacis-undecaprenol 4-epimerase [Pseudomonas sp. Bi123]